MDKYSNPSPFIRGKIHIYQPYENYRFNLDSVLLAYFFQSNKVGNLLDLGTGSGIIPILISLRYKNLKFYAVEIQKEFIKLALKNFKLNNLTVNLKQANIKNIKKIFTPNSFDYVITNPPYLKNYSSKNKGLKIAKSEYKASLEDFIYASKYVLKDRGMFYTVLPVDRFLESLKLLKKHKLQPKTIKFIHPSLSKKATNFLVKAQKNVKEGGEIIEPPFIIYEDTNKKIYTKQVEYILENFV